MNTPTERLLQTLQQKIVPKDKPIISGTVTAVDGASCSVQLGGSDLVIDEVALCATEDQGGLLATPKVNSEVLIAPIGGSDSRYCVIAFGELDGIEIKNEKTTLNIGENGVSLQRESEDLKKILLDFVGQVKKIIVVQGTSVDIPALQEIENKINTIFS